MTNDVVTVTTTLPAAHETEVNNLLGATKDVHQKLLKFKKGKFYIQDEEVPIGTEYVAHPSQLTLCWIKFSGGQVVDRRLGKAADGYRPPEREELGDLDESKWESGLDGKPKNPWSFQHLLPLEHPETGELVIFTTSSVGGEIGVKELVRAWAQRAKKGSRALPIVKLATMDMNTRKYGAVPRPYFPVIAWDAPPADDVKMNIADDAALSVAGELDDDIPF
jgi:hypothetical protein